MQQLSGDSPPPPSRPTSARSSSGGPRQRVLFGKVWIDSLTFAEAIDEIERLVDRGEGGAVFTPNIDHVVQVDSNPDFEAAYAQASLALVDGQPLLWASHLLGAPLPEKISGSDLLLPLMRRAEQRKLRVYLLGGAPGVAAQAADKLKEQFDISIVGVDAPMVSKGGKAEDQEAVVARITEAQPHIVLVAFGAPKQELFIHGTMAAIRPAVAIGVGAGFDFVAGRVKRAPRWISSGGLEWLFRLAQEPRRLARRYLVDDPQFLAILLRTMRLPRAQRISRERR